MPKKGKKSGKLSKMTEEERLAYEEQKRLQEEEMKKKKEDMLTQFLKVYITLKLQCKDYVILVLKYSISYILPWQPPEYYEKNLSYTMYKILFPQHTLIRFLCTFKAPHGYF